MTKEDPDVLEKEYYQKINSGTELNLHLNLWGGESLQMIKE